MQQLHGQHVLILGLGASGLAMARWCARAGADVTVADTRELPPQLATLQAEWPQVKFVSGAFAASLVEGTSVRAVFRSPGLSPEVVAPVVDAAKAIGLWQGGELSLFAAALQDLKHGHQRQDHRDVADRSAGGACWQNCQSGRQHWPNLVGHHGRGLGAGAYLGGSTGPRAGRAASTRSRARNCTRNRAIVCRGCGGSCL